MTQTDRNVAQFPTSDPPAKFASGGDGGGDGVSGRLAAIEARLTGLEAHLQHMATREDIQELRVENAKEHNKTLKWLIGVVVAALVALVAAVIRTFF